MNFPEIILLPLKYVSWGLWKVNRLLPNFHWRHMAFSPCTEIYNQYVRFQRESENVLKTKYGALDPEKNFKNIHFHFPILALRIVAHLTFVLNYGFTYISYFFMKTLSAGQCRNIDVISINNENGIFFLEKFFINKFNDRKKSFKSYQCGDQCRKIPNQSKSCVLLLFTDNIFGSVALLLFDFDGASCDFLLETNKFLMV